MIAVIFEVWPTRREDYLDIAAKLKPILETIDGFISVERFREPHREGQAALAVVFPRRGCRKGLAQCRRAPRCPSRRARRRVQGLPVAHRRRIRDYGMTERAQAPTDRKAAHKVVIA